MAEPLKPKVSITFQAPERNKNWLEGIANSIGIVRVLHGVEIGNISVILNWMIDYVQENKESFIEFMVAKLTDGVNDAS